MKTPVTASLPVPILVLVLALGLLLSAAPVLAERATPAEMERVCENWLTTIATWQGNWAGTTAPTIRDARDIRAGDEVVGRCFAIAPRGFVVVPALKEMPPVKAYSDHCDLDIDEPVGLALLLREGLQTMARRFIAAYGSLDAPQSPAAPMFEPVHRAAWDLEVLARADFAAALQAGRAAVRAEVGPLLTSAWHQNAPYNNLCPMGNGGRCVVGCVATATAQILRYWASPVTVDTTHTYWWAGDGGVGAGYLSAYFGDSYDWDNMPDDCAGGCTTVEENALAELCYEVGVAYDMNYGYGGSSAKVWRAVTVLPTYFAYQPSADREDRDAHTAASWFDVIKTDINAGRPMLYRIAYDSTGGHAIVCDGWRDTGGSTEYHMNYGWGGSHDAWYAIDHLYHTYDIDEEYLVRRIKPACILQADGSGSYPTIQAAVDALDSGDTIVLEDGLYSGSGNCDVNYHGKNLTIRSGSGNPEDCIIDCGGTERGFDFWTGETRAAVLEGVTIRNGWAWLSGGAIICNNSSSPTIRNCVFKQNTAGTYGGGIHCYSNCSPYVSGCTFYSNGADYGGGIYLTGTSSAVVERCIIAFSSEGASLTCSGTACVPSIRCCDFYGNPGGDWTGPIAGLLGNSGNLALDPLLCTPFGRLVLCEDSPCLPANNACGQLIGALGAGCSACGGACCTDITCEMTSEGVCTSHGGDWLAFETTCSTNPCPAACCSGDDCELLSADDCAAISGTWHPEWSACSPNPCPLRACCTGLTCQMVSREDCTALGGDWYPGATTCDPSPCPAVCCMPSSWCYVIGEQACSDSGGVRHEEYGASCSPNPCPSPPPLGACCLAGHCSVTIQSACGGTWLPGFVSCSPNPCSAACCRDGVCYFQDRYTCAAMGGTWYVNQGSCTPNPCPPDSAVCCYRGECTVTTQADCRGTWHWQYESCSEYTCPEYLAACCVDGHCSLHTAADCAGAGGQWMPDYETCDPNPCSAVCCTGVGCQVTTTETCAALDGVWYVDLRSCEVNPCPAVCCRGGSCFFVDEMTCQGMGGSWYAEGVSCDPNPCFYVITPDSSGLYPTIQSAINAVTGGGQVIALTNGVFDVAVHEAGEPNGIDYKGKAVTIKSLSGNPAQCIVDCENGGRGFNLHSGEGYGSKLQGITIRNGTAPDGAGILCAGASPAITACVIRDCVAGNNGGGLACIGAAAPTLVDCEFWGNLARQDGGGLYATASSAPWLSGCTFAGNSAQRGGGMCSTVGGNGGELTGCTFHANAAALPGGGGGIYCSGLSYGPVLQRVLVAASTAGEAIACDPQSVPTLWCCDLFGNAGGDWVGLILPQFGGTNIAQDPLFCAAPGNLSVCANSPCLPPNSPCGQLIGAHGLGCVSCAGPMHNLADGVLIVHHPPELQFTEDPSSGSWCQLYEDSLAIAGCTQQHPRIDTDEGTIWFVLAAWNDDKQWRTTEFGFGDYDPALYNFVAWGPCFPATGTVAPSNGWPGPGEGVTLTCNAEDWSGNYVPVAWFAGYAYGQGLLPLAANPATGFAGTSNGLFPPGTWPAVCLGGLGVRRAGIACCPDAPAAPGVCCLGAECFFTDVGQCDNLGGRWHPEWSGCDPNPCDDERVCCIGTNCQVTSEVACHGLAGVWHHEWTTCTPDPCAGAPHWADHNVGNCVLTVTDQGTLGFLDNSQSEGSGFIYPIDGANVLFLGSLWVGADTSYVASHDYDADPEHEWRVSTAPDGRIWVAEPGVSDQDIHASYDDSAAVTPHGIFVAQESWAFAGNELAIHHVTMRYTLRNLGSTALHGLYAGVFLDLDFDYPVQSTGAVDTSLDLAYLKGLSGPYAGVCLLQGAAGDPPPANASIIEQVIYCWPLGYIRDRDKFGFLSAMSPAYVVLQKTTMNDYSVVASAGPFDLAPGAERTVAFAVVGGETLEELKTHARVARLIHTSGYSGVEEQLVVLPLATRLLPAQPNPFARQTLIRFDLARASDLEVGIFDVGGRLVRTLASGPHAPMRYALIWDGRDRGGLPVPGGVYFVRMTASGEHTVQRVIRVR